MRASTVTTAVLLASLALSAGAGASDGLSPAQLDAAHQRTAGALDRAMIAAIGTPPGTTRLTAEPAGDGGHLTKPGTLPEHAPAITQVAFWSVPAGSLDGIAAGFAARVPGSHGGASTAGYLGGSEQEAATMIRLGPVDPDAIGSRYLIVTAAPLAAGGIGVRADAITEWNRAQPLSERIPNADRLTVTEGATGKRAAFTRTVGAPSTIHRIAAGLNALPQVPPRFECFGGYVAPAPLDTVTFRFLRGRAHVATFTTTAAALPTTDNCSSGVSASVGGHPQPALWTGGRVLALAHRLIGLPVPAA